jgi:uncharacterized membrane protein YkvA (DUF1232 family)
MSKVRGRARRVVQGTGTRAAEARLLRGLFLIRRIGVRNVARGVRHFPGYVRFYGRLFRDPRTPLAAKGLLAGTALYLLSPLDLLPDVVPLFGQMDDLALAVFALGRFLAMVPARVRHEHEAAAGLARGIPSAARRRGRGGEIPGRSQA